LLGLHLDFLKLSFSHIMIMKKITTKKIFYWLIGETAGRSIVGVWKWLWGLPIEPGGKIAQKVAQESLQSMQLSVANLTDSVAKVIATYQRVENQYKQKQQEFYDTENQAKLAYQKGNQDAARLAIAKAISIEKILPQLGNKVQEIEKTMIAAKAKLTREREKVEAYKLNMANMEALTAMNSAMGEISKITTDLDIESAQTQFESAQSSIEMRFLQENVKAELAGNTTKKLQDEIDALVTEDEIARRFQQLLVENN
jgi:phage shock protein A